MFWRFGGYANVSAIDTILEKSDFTLEDLLDESDLIQELKQHNPKLIEYLREDAVLQELLEYVVAPKLEAVDASEDASSTVATATADEESKGKSRLLPFPRARASSRLTDNADNEEDELEKKRNRYAFVACEVLSSDAWSIYGALAENPQLIRDFWTFLNRPAPLDPLQASYFTKVNESLFEKKTEEMMELLRELPDAVPNLLKHVECPMVMDLLLKIIALDRSEGGQGIVEWLYSKDIIPSLLSCLSPEHSWVVQTAAGDFIKAIITISANASQNEQQCIGPNELTRQLVSGPCVNQLIGYMLGGGNPLTVGVGVVIEVIRKNNSDYDPDVGTEVNAPPSSRDPIFLGTLLRLFAEHVPQFMTLMTGRPATRAKVDSTFGDKLEPLGFDRFKTCELMAELLHCSNMGLLNEVGAEQIIASRDAERHRLRAQGMLVLPKEDVKSTDDLTMRLRRAASDENRRLEVTNADDDEFEEVDPSQEMNEDTSHEFVKAEHGIAQTSATRMDKDEDEFIDEPLSSPRLTVGLEMANEQQFDEADLLIAPLSPTKPTPLEPALTTAATTSDMSKDSNLDTIGEPVMVRLEKIAEASGQEQRKETSGSSGTVDMAVAIDKPEGRSEFETGACSIIERPDKEPELSPHPEDTPAPLFSTSSTALPPDSGPTQASGQDLLSAPSHSDEGMRGSETELPVASISAPEAVGERSHLQGGEGDGSGEPVVGDFLKIQFVEYRVVPTILTFFLEYPWNNFLHNVVYDIVQQVFNGPMDRGYNTNLAISLFSAADITHAIIHGQKMSDESQAKTKTRMGYMGHLTLIAEEVVKFTERHPPELLSESVLDKVMSQDWINYVEGALAETRERDNAILGGVRPEAVVGHRGSIGGAGGLAGVGLSSLGGSGVSGGSSALGAAGLNGGVEVSESDCNGIGTFTISGGTLISGFGSSSDEEEGADGDEEDTNSEFRAYPDSFGSLGGNQNNDSRNGEDAGTRPLAPPSIPPPPPPPPPPLNIPPSRARRQLAARLAMHQKDIGAMQSSALTLDNDHGLDTEGHDGLSADPFADVADGFDEEREDDEDEPTQGECEEDDYDEDAFSGVQERGSWWRGMLSREGPERDESDDGNGKDDDVGDIDDDEEFGDFTMAESDTSAGQGSARVDLQPLFVGSSKEAGRGLGGLWPFGSRTDKDRNRSQVQGQESSREESGPLVSDKANLDSRADAELDRDESDETGPQRAVQVSQAKRRTSIEDAVEEEEEATYRA